MVRKLFIFIFLVSCFPILLVAQSNPGNGYIRKWTPHKPIVNAADVISVSENNPDAVKQVTTYYDGFGRPVQTVSKQASPQGKDVVSLHVYDNLGRETKRYLPFVSNSTDGDYKVNALSALNVFNQTIYPNEGNYFYSKTVYENSPLNRVLSSYAPGANWVGSSRGGSTSYLVNTTADNVQIWNIAPTQGSLPVSAGAYPAGKLYKTIITDIKGKQTITYKNTEGQVILKKVQLTASADNGSGSSHAGWLCTYYVYDDYNNLRFVIPPKAVNYLRTHSWTMTQPIADKLCFRNEYDNKNRKIIQKVPGAEEVQLVYDLRDRLVFSQDGNQRNNGRWTITYYDALNRPVETGIYTDATATRASLQQAMDALGNNGSGGSGGCAQIPAPNDLVISSRTGNQPAEYIARNSITFMPGFEAPAGDEFTATIDPNAMVDDPNCSGNSGGSTENPLPPVPSSLVTPLTYTYYDNYNWSGHQAFKSNYLNKTTAAGNPYPESPSTYGKETRGLVTGTKVRVLGSSPVKWLTTTTYYDDKGRILQTITENITGSTDVITNKYDLSGKLLSSYVVNHNNNSALTPETRVLTENKYDGDGRLLTVTKTINDNASIKRVIATNTYDALSRLKTTTLGNNLETLHYDYNIRGWLTGINKAYTQSGNTAHYFGMELGYDKSATKNGTTTFTPMYNGNISGEIWKSKGDGIPRKYDFSYDNVNRLTAAAFNQNNSGSSWSTSTVDFSVNNIGYDANGNITRMKQHGLKGSSSPLIDDLTYTYQSHSNQLLKVTDAANDPNTTLGDFHDGTNSGNDYTYDDNGNLTKDLNKGISSISYNYLNLPKQITVSGKGTIKFVYDATGNKLQKIVKDNTVSPSRTVVTNYVDGFIYGYSSSSGGGQVGVDTLQFFSTENGRVRYIPPYGSTPGSYVYDYFIMDHLGNTRMVLTEQTDFTHYLASMESGKSAKENALFYNINNTRVPKPFGYPQDNVTDANTAVAKLNGSDPDRRIGPSIILKVMAGDTIQAAVRAYYKKQVEPKKRVNIPAEQMLAGLLQTFTAPAIPAISSHGMSAATNARKIAPGLTAADLQSLKQKDPNNKKLDKPKAYLNYVFFDNQLNFVEEGSGLRQVDGEAGKLETLSSGKVVAKKDGYVYIFTSNESQQDVFFDNLGVTQTTGPILDETHYYPFGLTMAAISQTVPLKIQGRRKFNGITFNHQEFGDGFGLNLYTAYYRSLDPQIGRWWQIDPKAGSFMGLSPYAAMGNNPLLYNDPNGDCIICLVILGAAVVNGLVNVGSQALKGNVNNLGQGLEYFAVGAVAGAVAVVPGGGPLLAGGIQAVGNKGVQYLNGQWDPSDINSVGDVANLTLDVGLDFVSAGAGAKLGAAIIKQTGWFTSVAASGHFVQIGEHITSGFRFAGNVEVTASRVGARAIQMAEMEAANAVRGGAKGGLNLFKFGAKQTTKLRGWKAGDRMLKMFDRGSPKLNWKQNSGFLRREMRAGNPIFDSYRLPNGNLIQTSGFLNAERNLLQSRGWIYSSIRGAWLPPGF